MFCKECNGKDVLIIRKPSHVKFICKNGHTWTEEYTDNGGIHIRPDSYEIQLEDTLFSDEKKLYKKVIKEIAKNQQFFIQSTPSEIADYLVQVCNSNYTDIHILFKKIEKYGTPKTITGT